MPLRAIAINCTLKGASVGPSSTDRMIGVLAAELERRGIECSETVRVADHDVRPRVGSDEGDGDDWPELRRRILEHDILIFATPIWLGQMSSIAKRVLERMDAFLGETDARGRMPSFSKVALVAVVGNEDGAHNVCAALYQALSDTGWTIPPAAAAYWVGAAMGKTDFKDLPQVPDEVKQAAALAAANAAHLAGLLHERGYPGVTADPAQAPS